MESLALEPEEEKPDDTEALSGDDPEGRREKSRNRTQTMTIELSILELAPPKLQFGGASTNTDPKAGLERAKARGVRLGRPRTGAKVEAVICALGWRGVTE